ncbi:MAG: hypothetical protein H0W70_00300 [Actinobacteria bacterium]|nr:hypothetical protein [Actinomycetota bacterium]
MRSRASLLIVLASSLTLNGCNHQFAFRQDRRIHIVAPDNNATVTAPVIVRWRARDTNGEAFAVFVDRSPIPPGTGLRSIGRSDDQCRQKPSCPDAAYLAERGVFVTTQPTLALPGLGDKRKNKGDKDQHDVTIIFVDQSAQRVGEAAFSVSFVIDHPKQ